MLAQLPDTHNLDGIFCGLVILDSGLQAIEKYSIYGQSDGKDKTIFFSNSLYPVAETIYGKLDNNSLLNCEEICPEIHQYVCDPRFWLKKLSKSHEDHYSNVDWNAVRKSLPSNNSLTMAAAPPNLPLPGSLDIHSNVSTKLEKVQIAVE